MIADYDAKHDPRTPILSPEEKKVFVDTFTKTGFTGGINWYRNFSRNWQRSEGLDHTVRVPSLMIMAENDAVLPPSAADGMEKIVPDLEKYLVRDSGHWTQQEKPDEVSAKLIEWRREAVWVRRRDASSLRAKRSNPWRGKTKDGLLRRFARCERFAFAQAMTV